MYIIDIKFTLVYNLYSLNFKKYIKSLNFRKYIKFEMNIEKQNSN